MTAITVAAPFVLDMLEGARIRGFDIEKILLENDISRDILQQSRARVTLHKYGNLSRSLMRLLNDETYGLLDKPQRQNTFKLMCYCAINAETIEDALKIFIDFMNMLENSFEHTLIKGDRISTYQLTRRPQANIVNSYAIEHLFVTIHRTLCWMANVRIPILRADLDYDAPKYQSEYRYLFYGAPALFSQSHCALSFNSQANKLQNVRNTTQLNQFLKLAPLTLLTQTIQSDDLGTRLRNWLEKNLVSHQLAADVDQAAEYFNMHPQAIRRVLKKECTSFQDIKMEIRRDLAINLINNQQHSIEQISEKLGFSEQSSFFRAFKNWTGLTPLAYRKLGVRQISNDSH
ncbi:MAG: AraC-like DNA-binding protein [Oceanicoccus sp.]|jgi:AraC-like DNA-binding protein